MTGSVNPTVEELGIDAGALACRRSTDGPGAIEVAFAQVGKQEWILMRLTRDPDGQVSVFSGFEWDCLLDGVRNGEFDDAASWTHGRNAQCPCMLGTWHQVVGATL